MLPAAYKCLMQKLCQMTATPDVPNICAMVVSCDTSQSRLETGHGAHDVTSLMTDSIESTCAFSLCISALQADLHALLA